MYKNKSSVVAQTLCALHVFVSMNNYFITKFCYFVLTFYLIY